MKLKRWKLLTVLIAAFVLVATVSVSVYAYFSTRVYVYTEDGKEVAHLGMNLQLLFGKLDQTLDGTALPIPYYAKVNASGEVLPYDQEQTETLLAQYPHNAKLENPTFDPDAPWGSPQNPYIIANERHLQNLSALQNIGYFDMMYIENNFTYNEGTATYTYNDGISMPYFLICDENGAPVVIDATDIGEIKPVGSAEHPFIGVVGGAFAEGTAIIDINGDGTLNAENDGDKTTSVSTLHGVKVQTNTDQTDVGLFGYVGYLGTEPDPNNKDDLVQVIGPNGEPLKDKDNNPVMTVKTTFEGVVSILENFTLSDVQIKVEKPGLVETVSKFFASILGANHNLTYTAASGAGVPHEDHHIGILAGHVSYASVEYISVYYSSGDICAIDLLHTKNAKDETIPNYHSTTGILGFMHNMNSSVTNQWDATNGYTGHCLVSVGGTSSDGLTLIPGGQGTGGGKEIGIGPGYVMAKTLYDGFHYVAENQSLYDRIWSFKVGTNTYYGMMYFQDADGNIKSQNNNTVTIDANGTATETLSGSSTKSYKKYVIQTLETQTDGTIEEIYTFYNASTTGTVIDRYACEELPQAVWQYAAQKPTDNNEPTWTEAVLLVEQSDGSYTLTDNKTKVTVTGTGTTARINGAVDANGNAATISSVFFRRKSGEYSLTATGDVVAPVFFREKPLFIQTAKNKYGTNLCEPATEGITLGGEQGFYFYDGVFTFALSDSKDTIEDLWENDTPDDIVLGPNTGESWTTVPYEDNYSVVAFLRKITDLSQLKDGQTIFIGYYDDTNAETGSWKGGKLSVMSLMSSDASGNWWEGDNNFTTDSNTKTFLTDEECKELIAALKDENPDSQLAKQLEDNQLQVLNLETAANLTALQNNFKIISGVTSNTDGTLSYNFSATNGNYLGLLRCRYDALGFIPIVSYSIWAGTGQAGGWPNNSSRYSYNFVDTASITSGTVAETFRILYQNTNQGRYVNYNQRNGVFGGVNSNSDTIPDTTNLCFYVIEEMKAVPMDYVNFAPKDGVTEYDPINKTGNSFPADQYILWPNAIMTPEGTMVAGSAFGDAYTLITEANGAYTAEDFKTDGTNYDTYKLVSLNELIAQNSHWQNGLGAPLSKNDLHKKFTMQRPLDFSLSLKIPGIDNIQLGNGSVVAPVGPGGALANIPTGSIAFRINKTGESKIRVIVSVPTSRFYDGTVLDDQEDQLKVLTTEVDYYLGLWKTEDLNDDEWALNTFDMGSAEQKFELPRSRPYEPGTSPDDADYILVSRDGTSYRCYLNGDSILVGYEFTVTEPGTYIVGTTAGRWTLWDEIFNTGNNIDNSYPMEIVYCSADGTASPGRDGTSTSAYGSIDYVYDYNNTIVHVQDYETELPAKENYQYYYSSHVITYTDNELKNGNTFVSINNLQVCVQRKIDTGQDSDGVATQHSAIYVNVKSPLAGEFTCKTAGVETDDIHVTYEGQRTDSTS